MAISKKSTKINRYMLSGAQKKSGVNTWRYVFTGVENTTGQERRFFIELSMKLNIINIQSMEYWSKMVSDIKHMAIAWRSNDKKR